MRRLRIGVAIAVVITSCVIWGGIHPSAQSLNAGLFERYLDALRQEYRIPGLSLVVVQNGNVVMSRGFGQADVSLSVPARPDTPYLIANLSETIGAALVLRHCVDFGTAELNDEVARWLPPGQSVAEPRATFESVLGHVGSTGAYGYNPDRFATAGPAAAECAEQPYPVLAGALFDFLAMRRSVPGRDAVDAGNSSLFPLATADRYRAVLSEVATPYRISGGVATRNDVGRRDLTAATGIVSTALDLAAFDAALDRGLVLSPPLVQTSTARGPNRPTGLGWFVQQYPANGERVVWHFGLVKDSYSSLIIKLPAQRLTVIMLANSDALAAAINPAQPDVTQSIFAKTFLRLFVG